MEIIETDEFKKDFKKLLKKYRTLEKDFEIAQKAIIAEPTGDGSRHWTILKRDGDKYILKTRMMCRAVRGSSFRLVYFYYGEAVKVLFIEIYFKGIKETEDKKRIDNIFDKFS